MSTRTEYLLEVGTEELPVSFLKTAIGELKTRAADALQKNRLGFEHIEVLHTPRRLTLIIHGLESKQSAVEELLKGPPVSMALAPDGTSTPAAIGFARKNGIEATELQRETIDGAEYLVYHKCAEGEAVEAVLPRIMPDVVLGLSGSHFMSWDESHILFSRPIRWLVSLLNNQPLPLTMGLLTAGNASRGHRFLTQSPQISIQSVESYAAQLLKEGHVQADPAKRKALILDGLIKQSQLLGGEMIANEDLLETVTMLVEAPSLITGGFEDRFLTLPPEVIITVMESHQKYFAVANPKGGILPYFITIANNPNPQAAETIRHGNEKVLRARLEDAAFFFAEDTRHPLSHFVESLKGITFQKGLGTLWDKTQRLQALVALLGQSNQLPAETVTSAVQAAQLCKADLATALVRELTELQGVMGMHYARHSQEAEAVAIAIEAHYHPRFMGDTVAQSPAGILLSIADKLDTIVAVFSLKDARLPTGSKDPMGLRRLTNGLILTIIENQTQINIEAALQASYDTLGDWPKDSQETTLARVNQFLMQRFKSILLEKDFAYDAIDAVLEAGISPWADILSVLNRLVTLKTLREDPIRFTQNLYEPANRTARILAKSYQPDSTLDMVDTGLFEDPLEEALYKALASACANTPATPALRTQQFLDWAPVVDGFYEKVLVNADKIDVRENRIRLLSLLNTQYRQFADFTKLVV